MEFIVEQSALVTALNHLRGIVAARNTIPILSNLMIVAGRLSRKMAPAIDKCKADKNVSAAMQKLPHGPPPHH